MPINENLRTTASKSALAAAALSAAALVGIDGEIRTMEHEAHQASDKVNVLLAEASDIPKNQPAAREIMTNTIVPLNERMDRLNEYGNIAFAAGSLALIGSIALKPNELEEPIDVPEAGEQ